MSAKYAARERADSGTGTARADRIYKLYGITAAARIGYTLDHLIPPEIGGADVVENLWPEPRRSLAGEWDDMRKDQLERRLAALVCSGQLDVVEAQREIADDWPGHTRGFSASL